MSETQNTNPSTPRDYDKDPIVIEDYNPKIHMPFIFIVGAVFLYLELFFHKKDSFAFWALIFFPAVTFYFVLRKAKRVVELKTDTFVYRDDTEVLESIHINEISSIERTFNDFYRKKQKMDPDWTIRIWLSKLLSPLLIVLIIEKFIFHLFKNRLSAYKLFDAILISTQDGRVINILPNDNDEYEMVKEYFLEKCSVDITTVETTIITDYINEEFIK
ncbi:hypothetical protein [Sulfuricurvum sp.]|uniref:hypothetical protein n=1 Tax=Sulfuricurvum sp. TaxID=2025608 RepID=UPI0026399B76|nr:hypothetical protein [Sulfuricurvum sp.]MDD4950738.1 hypothetical protein [Sulfuricurvum sp.]